MPNTDVYLHAHWGHNGTSISGNLVITWYAQYCQGYTQSGQLFNSELSIPQTISTPNIATYPQWAHNISEFAITNTVGDSTHINNALIQPDGLMIVSFVTTTIPSISGGSPNEPFIFFADLHYQSTQLTTKHKNYPFYT